jgi:hypothetical protein
VGVRRGAEVAHHVVLRLLVRARPQQRPYALTMAAASRKVQRSLRVLSGGVAEGR